MSESSIYSVPITKGDQEYILSLLINPGYWGELKPDCLNSISRITQMNSKQIKSLYKWALINKAFQSQHRLRKLTGTLYNSYRRGESIMILSRKYDLPPVAIFRALLSHAGRSKKNIKKIINQPSMNDFISLYDYAQLLTAFENDNTAISTKDHILQLKTAYAFENEIQTLLQARNIRFATENTLSDLQMEFEGRAVSTPDFLLLDGLMVQGKKIYWIECKSYFGATVPILQTKVYKQSQRYARRWGPGVVVFKYGHTKDFPHPRGVEIKDISFLT